jgi:hypothetical protein
MAGRQAVAGDPAFDRTRSLGSNVPLLNWWIRFGLPRPGETGDVWPAVWGDSFSEHITVDFKRRRW